MFCSQHRLLNCCLLLFLVYCMYYTRVDDDIITTIFITKIYDTVICKFHVVNLYLHPCSKLKSYNMTIHALTDSKQRSRAFTQCFNICWPTCKGIQIDRYNFKKGVIDWIVFYAISAIFQPYKGEGRGLNQQTLLMF